MAPTAFPHATTADDEIDGMVIPKGSTVILNTWGMHHNPQLYPDHETFLPSRFAAWSLPASHYTNGREGQHDHYGYGAGRRICPGLHLAERGLWLGIAKTLWGFDITPARDSRTGNHVPIDVDPAAGYHDGFLLAPKDFQVEMRVRSDVHRDTIFREFDMAEAHVFGKYDTEVNGL